MANSYRTWAAETEQDWVTQCDLFLVNVAGWYRAYTHTDSGSDRSYTWVSEGEGADSRAVRIASASASNDTLLFRCGIEGEFNFASGGYGSSYLGSSGRTTVSGQGVPGRCRLVANKDRFGGLNQTSLSDRWSFYVGAFNSFYSPTDDAAPFVIRGQNNANDSWTTSPGLRALRADGTDVSYGIHLGSGMADEGYPNPRNGEFSFYNPFIYYDGSFLYNEVRGRLSGAYYGRADRLGHGSFVVVNDDYYLVTKTTTEDEAILFGPVSADKEIPIEVVDQGYPYQVYLKANYSSRGFRVDATASGTLALWRFDVGHLNGYQYGTTASLPVPTTYPDEEDMLNLTAQNGLSSVPSRLREAASFNGTTHYAVSSGTGPTVSALLGEWTFECIFKPTSVPTGSGIASLCYYSAQGGTEADNTLLGVSLIAASGTTPDSYNVQRANLRLEWEKDLGQEIVLQTSGDFVQQDRWNYIAVVKSYNGGNYDLSVWHCSFGDYTVAGLEQTFLAVDNATGGSSSSLYFGCNSDLANFYAGELDDSRITKRALSSAEILEGCSRTML